MLPYAIHERVCGSAQGIGGDAMAKYDATHPVWAILRTSVIMLTLIIVLKMTASQFDETELRTILVLFITAAVGEGVVNRLVQTSKGS